MNNPTVAERPAHDAAGLVSDMRQLVQRAPAPTSPEDRDQLERSVSVRIATLLMMLLVLVIFVTSAVPDVGPSLAKVIQAHL
jgi:hypothetical protein